MGTGFPLTTSIPGGPNAPEPLELTTEDLKSLQATGIAPLQTALTK